MSAEEIMPSPLTEETLNHFLEGIVAIDFQNPDFYQQLAELTIGNTGFVRTIRSAAGHVVWSGSTLEEVTDCLCFYLRTTYIASPNFSGLDRIPNYVRSKVGLACLLVQLSEIKPADDSEGDLNIVARQKIFDASKELRINLHRENTAHPNIKSSLMATLDDLLSLVIRRHLTPHDLERDPLELEIAKRSWDLADRPWFQGAYGRFVSPAIPNLLYQQVKKIFVENGSPLAAYMPDFSESTSSK